MNDRETIQLLQAEADRNQDLIRGLKEAAEKLTIRITDADILAARYQGEREMARLRLSRFRLAAVAALSAIRIGPGLSPEADATAWRIETFLGLHLGAVGAEVDELAAHLDSLPWRDPKDAAACTGLSASWCPVHGECICDRLGDLDDPACPLHNSTSTHDDDARRDIESARMVVGEGVRARRRRIESAEEMDSCTSHDALSCPVHGKCRCTLDSTCLDRPAQRNTCPLHGDQSFHAAPMSAAIAREAIGDPGRCVDCNGLIDEEEPHICPRAPTSSARDFSGKSMKVPGPPNPPRPKDRREWA